MNLYVEHTLSTKIYNKAHNKDKDSEEVFVDPATLILIGKISIRIIRLIKSCKDSNEERLLPALQGGPQDRSVLAFSSWRSP